MQCASLFRSILRLERFCTIQDDADVSVPKENGHCPYVAALWPSSMNSMNGLIFSACRALLFRVGHTEKHSLPVRHTTGPGRGGSQLDSVRTTAGGATPHKLEICAVQWFSMCIFPICFPTHEPAASPSLHNREF